MAEPTDRQRNAAFNAERRRQLARGLKLRRDAFEGIAEQLRRASTQVRGVLAGAPTDYQQWILPQLEQQIAAALAEVERAAVAVGAKAVDQTWQAGADLIDQPLAAGGVQVSGVLPAISTAQLTALRATTSHLIKNITADALAKINTDLALTVIGAQPVSDTIARIAETLEKGGRSRALTVTRTELGRVYATAVQTRMEQAAELVPGLKKQWRRSGKVRSRARHDAADGQVRAVNAPFRLSNGVELLYPRDPTAPAAETINCGCESLPYMDGWDVTNPAAKPYTTQEEFLKRRDGREPVPPGTAAGV